jgi:general secretion pathway protein C
LQQRAPELVCAVLAVGIGVQLASLIADVGGSRAPEAARTDAPGLSPPGTPGTPGRQRVDLATIVGAHLFGEAAAPATLGPAPPSSLPLSLAGVIAVDDPATGYAIVGESPASAKLHAVGAELPGGALLRAVYADHVLVEHDGRLERLDLPRRLLALVADPAVQPATADAGVAAVAEAPTPVENALIDERLRRAIAENPGFMANVLRTERALSGGRTMGVRVFSGTNAAAFARLGLAEGELITAINGTTVDDRTNVDDLVHALGESSEARVTIQRGGRPTDLLLDLSVVASDATTPATQGAAASSGQDPPT